MHLRARSAPSTPSVEIMTSPSGANSTGGSVSPTATGTSTPKNVHFSTTDLETVRIFNRSAKPASLLGDETETETEGEFSGEFSGRYTSASAASAAGGFPFPRVTRQGTLFANRKSNPGHQQQQQKMEKKRKEEGLFELDLNDYPIPSVYPPANAFVHLESLEIVNHNATHPNPALRGPATGGGSAAAAAAQMMGSVLVKNVSFEKQVFVRFTLDEWQTTSEVGARYASSVNGLPVKFLPRTVGDLMLSSSASTSATASGSLDGGVGGEVKENWDRFAFTIRLEDYMSSLENRTMWLVVRLVFCNTHKPSASYSND